MTDHIQKAIDEANAKGIKITLIQPRNVNGVEPNWRCLGSHYGTNKEIAMYGSAFGYGETAVEAIRDAVKNFMKDHPHIYSAKPRKRKRLTRKRL